MVGYKAMLGSAQKLNDAKPEPWVSSRMQKLKYAEAALVKPNISA